MDLRERLQSALGIDYALQRELGGGGMSRVFLARDERLGRDVVVKVLSPELAEGLSAERFEVKGKSTDLRTIAEQLQVRTLLEGSVRRAGNRVPHHGAPRECRRWLSTVEQSLRPGVDGYLRGTG